MNAWWIALIALGALFCLLEAKNRRERPVYARLEREYHELLDGRFQAGPVQRRRFMRALYRYAYAEKGEKMALAMFRGIALRATDAGDRASCELMMALCLEEMGESDAAMKLYDTLCAEDPEFGLAQRRRAHLLSAMGRPESVAAYEKVIERYPNDAVQRNNYASALLRQNHLDEALAQLQKTLELDASLGSARGLIALVYARKGDSERAERAFQDAVAHGEDADALRGILDGARG